MTQPTYCTRLNALLILISGAFQVLDCYAPKPSPARPVTAVIIVPPMPPLAPAPDEAASEPRKIYTHGFLARCQVAEARIKRLERVVLRSPVPYAGCYLVATGPDGEPTVLFPAPKESHEYYTPEGCAAIWQVNTMLHEKLMADKTKIRDLSDTDFAHYRTKLYTERDQLLAAAAKRDELARMHCTAEDLHDLDTTMPSSYDDERNYDSD